MLDEQIAEMRIQTQAEQVSQIQSRRQKRVLTTTFYQGRDRSTGLRQVLTADGGREFTRYLSNSTPQTTLFVLKGGLGQSALALQKPG